MNSRSLQFVWTFHALERLAERGLTREDVEGAVHDEHPTRETNPGKADWRIDTGRIVVLYDCPDKRDIDVIRIVTAWPKRRRDQRHLKSAFDKPRGNQEQ
jgi:hypothetical protein